MLVDGTWRGDWKPSDGDDAKGRFVRKPSAFREAITDWEPGRYHLYAAYICPWAHRTLITRALKGLEDALPVHIVEPELTDEGWALDEGVDPLHGAHHLWQLYVHADGQYTGRATVPLLWDSQRDTAVNNESSEILRQLDALPSDAPTLVPAEHLERIDELNALMYESLNNGVYRAGFAATQEAYDSAVADVFRTLDTLEELLAERDWLVCDRPTEPDIRLFVTAARFDLAYHGLFKCNLRRLADYPRLLDHTRRMLALPGVKQTFRPDHIQRGYYSIRALNPSGIVPAGPAADALGF